MSERGAWMTEYIYCYDCLKAVRDVMSAHGDGWTCTQLPNTLGGESDLLPPEEQHLFPILAGKAKGSYSGQERIDFEYKIIPKIQKVICHSHTVRFCVIAETGTETYSIPKSEDDQNENQD